MSNTPTFEQLRNLLSEDCMKVRQALKINEAAAAQFRIPVDGKGLRIQVAIPDRKDRALKIPRKIEITNKEGVNLSIPIEWDPDGFQEYDPHT